MIDEELSCIHGGMASGSEIMVDKRKHMQLAEVSSLLTPVIKGWASHRFYFPRKIGRVCIFLIMMFWLSESTLQIV